jgi:hypothetical protein
MPPTSTDLVWTKPNLGIVMPMLSCRLLSSQLPQKLNFPKKAWHKALDKRFFKADELRQTLKQ